MKEEEGLQWKIRAVRKCSRMFADVRRCSEKFLWMARAELWMLALLLLRLARQGKCRHNSFGLDLAGKAACCNERKSLDGPGSALADC